MGSGEHDGHLGAVYDATAPEDVAAIYDDWAETYDGEMARAGYRHPAVGLALLASHAPLRQGPVLDAGCGTGIVGDLLAVMGYRPVHGLDLSEGMLTVARRRGCYDELHHLGLGGPLPFADGHFAAAVSIGVFTTGHVGAEGLPELLRIIRPGGVLVLTVKTTLWDGEVGVTLEADAQVDIVETTAPYVSMPGEAGTIPSVGVAVLKRPR